MNLFPMREIILVQKRNSVDSQIDANGGRTLMRIVQKYGLTYLMSEVWYSGVLGGVPAGI